MPALDFPASPLAGDKYPVTPVAGQPQYTYDGVKWTTVGAQVTTAAPAAAVPLMDQTVGLVGTATKYAREDHVHPKVPAAGLDAYAYNGMQVNGSMEVSQELGTSPRTTAGYICDGWTFSYGGSMSFSCGIGTGLSASIPLPPWFISMATATAQPSLGSADYAVLQQTIEGYRVSRLNWGTANAMPITIGFLSCHTVPGVYSLVIQNILADRSYVTTYTQNAGNTVEYKTVTIPGATTGTWKQDSAAGLIIFFTAACGATYTAPSANAWLSSNYVAAPGQVNGVAAVNNTMRITGVVVLPGIEAPSAARSPFIMRPFDQELLTCRRYYYKSYYMSQAPGVNVGAGNNNIYEDFVASNYNRYSRHPVIMRASPAITSYDGAGNANRFGYYNGSWITNGTWSSGPFATDSYASFRASVGGAVLISFDYVADARL